MCALLIPYSLFPALDSIFRVLLLVQYVQGLRSNAQDSLGHSEGQEGEGREGRLLLSFPVLFSMF